VVINHEGGGGQHPTFARASQNVAVAAALLDTLPTPSTDWVDKVYQQLKNILNITTAQQAESSLQRQVEVSLSTLGRSRAGGAKGCLGDP
jgi:hypothetical protein